MARDWLVGILRNLNAKQDQEPTFANFAVFIGIGDFFMIHPIKKLQMFF